MSTASRDTPHRGLAAATYAALGLAALAGLFLISRYNFLLFHGLAELFSVAVAWSLFLLVWNTRKIACNDALLFLGIAYLCVGAIDLVHTLAFKGMGVFAIERASNTATQLWISARGLEAVSLLVFPLILGRRFSGGVGLTGFTALTAALLGSIFIGGIFPDTYIEGQGLTVFKKGAEYAISLVLMSAMALLYRRRAQIDRAVFRLMMAAIAATVAAELAFTFYVSVYGLSNMAGHLFKIVSFFLVYLALVRSAVTRPHATLFRNLGQAKDALAREGRQLQMLHRGAALFLKSESLEATLADLPALIAAHYEVPGVAIELYDADRQEMVLVGTMGSGITKDGNLRVPVDQTVSGTVATTGRAVVDLDVSKHGDYPAGVLGELNAVTFACVPLIGQE
ncbi:MAG: hypothetical protein GY697_17880, partial [Desulfobacterales bacterium]|nr:hypothetical protein [Desulfobacterales bacterium]